MKITLKDINDFLTANPQKRIDVSSGTNCVIAQILKNRGVKNPYCRFNAGSSTIKYANYESVIVPLSWNNYNDWYNFYHAGKKKTAASIAKDLRKFSRKGDSYYV